VQPKVVALNSEAQPGIKISIVTLSFNQRAYLQEAIESVVQQNYPLLDYIVVDPGSDDGSRELIQLYRTRIAHLLFEKDRGAADGLNKGFSLATGDVFGFLNADDILLPGSLQRVADFFRQHSDREMGLGNGYILDAAGRRVRHVRARGFTVHRYFHGGARWLQQSTFFRREAFLRSPGFNLTNRTCWDGELFINMKSQGAAVGYIDADLGGFRIHNASISGTGRSMQAYQEDCKRIFRDIHGRDWRTTDTLWKTYFRSEALAIKMAFWLNKRVKRETA
jgi:glycosyltransferase involved in cell wall biosynthesis